MAYEVMIDVIIGIFEGMLLQRCHYCQPRIIECYEWQIGLNERHTDTFIHRFDWAFLVDKDHHTFNLRNALHQRAAGDSHL